MSLHKKTARTARSLAADNAQSSLCRSTYIAKNTPENGTKAPLQTWNVMWNQKDGGILRKCALGGAPVFAKTRFFKFRNHLKFRLLTFVLADTPQPTVEKTRKNAPALTSTNQNAFLFRINSIPGMRRLGTKAECPLESVKRGYMANNVYKKSKTGMSFAVSDMSLIREMSKYEKSAPGRTGMSCRINHMTISPYESKRPFYLPVTSAAMSRKSYGLADFAGKSRFFTRCNTVQSRLSVTASHGYSLVGYSLLILKYIPAAAGRIVVVSRVVATSAFMLPAQTATWRLGSASNTRLTIRESKGAAP